MEKGEHCGWFILDELGLQSEAQPFVNRDQKLGDDVVGSALERKRAPGSMTSFPFPTAP